MTKNKIFSYFVLPALVFQLIGAYLYYIYLTDPVVIQVTYTVLKILLLVWPLVCFLVFRDKFKEVFFRFDQLTRKDMLIGVGSGLAIAGLIFTIYYVFSGYFNGHAADIQAKIDAWGLASSYLYFALFLSVIHSLAEEYYWRWFVFQGLQIRFKLYTAVIIGALAFASHHFIILSQFFNWQLTLVFGLAVGLGGVIWSLLFYKVKNFIPVWISHFFVDMAVMTVGYFIINS